jgi:hypothetical protein
MSTAIHTAGSPHRRATQSVASEAANTLASELPTRIVARSRDGSAASRAAPPSRSVLLAVP